MKKSHAILIGFALVAATIAFTRGSSQAQAGTVSPNYAIAVSNNDFMVWRLNTDSGAVSWCSTEGKKVTCTPWEK